MKPIQAVKNFIGDRLRYNRCPITGDSYFGLANRNWLMIDGYIAISKRALKAGEWTQDTVRNMAELIYIRTMNVKAKTETELRFKLDKARDNIEDIIEKLDRYREFLFPKLTT